MEDSLLRRNRGILGGIPIWNERLVSEVRFQNIAGISTVVVAVAATAGSDVRAVHTWAVLNHTLVDHTTHESVHAELVGLSQTDLLGEVVMALCRVVILLVRAVAGTSGHRTDGRGELVGNDVLHSVGIGQLIGHLTQLIEPVELPR